MAHIIQPIANSVRDLFIPERRDQARRDLKSKLEMAKTAAIAAAAAFTILFLLIPKITLFLLFLPEAYLFYETAVVLSNAQDLVDRIAIEGIGGLNRDNVVEQATRGAPAFRALARFAIARLQNADV